MSHTGPHGIGADDLTSKLEREWLETNGLGSYSSASVSGANTRRYHGLLVAALAPPVGRYVLLSRVEEEVLVGTASYPLSTNQYGSVTHPEGYRLITHFEARPVPTWHYAFGGVELERRIWMPHGRQSVAICYRLLQAPEGTAVRLLVRPLIAFRGFHELTRENRELDPSVEQSPGVLRIHPYESLPSLFLHHNASGFDSNPEWYRSFEYPRERERGFPSSEDLFSHGELGFDLHADSAFVYASLRRVEWLSNDTLVRLESQELGDRQRRASRALRVRMAPPGLNGAKPLDRWSETLATRLSEAADQFIVRRGEQARSIIAGYHWFEDWGRDAFISLAGLTLATGRLELPREVFSAFVAELNDGLLPNRFLDDTGAPEYGSADSALWFVEAVRRFASTTDDPEYVAEFLFPSVREILAAYRRGTFHGIAVDADGLLKAGVDGRALTWMDAVIEGEPVTPRRGKPVELNALWYNAVCTGADLCDRFGRADDGTELREAAELARRSFNTRFPTSDGWLRDVVDGPNGDEEAFRPNQLFAISLHYPVLDDEHWKTVVDEVERRLLTPMGLRTLDAGHPEYQGRYEGGPEERDRAYHNGTVWPWLLGAFGDAYLRAYGRTPESIGKVRATIQPITRHLGTEACIAQLSEIADGDFPHTARGCVAQAWSVAEVSRLLIETLR